MKKFGYFITIIGILFLFVLNVQADIIPNVDTFKSISGVYKVMEGDIFSLNVNMQYTNAVVYDSDILEVVDASLKPYRDDISTDECIIEYDILGAVTINCDVIYEFDEELTITFRVIGTNEKNSTEIFTYCSECQDYHFSDEIFLNIINEKNFQNNIISKEYYIPPKELAEKIDARLYSYRIVKRDSLYDFLRDDNCTEKVVVKKESNQNCDNESDKVNKNTINILGLEITIMNAIIILLSIIGVLLIIIILLIVKCKKQKKKGL